jgi:transposase
MCDADVNRVNYVISNTMYPITSPGSGYPGLWPSARKCRRARYRDFEDRDSTPTIFHKERTVDVLHVRCAVLDVHKEQVTACRRIASDGKASQEVRGFSTMTSGLLALAEWLTEAGCTHVAMEATGVYWKPVWHILEGSFELVLANAQHVRNVPGRKSDVNDAMWLADLLAHGLIRGSFVPPTPVQEMRDLTRTRKQLVREVTQHIQRIQKTLEDANIKLGNVISDVVGTSGRAFLKALIDGETDPHKLASLAHPSTHT